MSDYKVLLTDRSPFPDLKVQREVFQEINAELVECKNEEDVKKNISDVDAVMVAYYEISPELIDKMDNVKIISRTGIGVDNIPLKKASEKGIYVTNVPSYCVDEVSSHALGLLLSCALKIPQLNNAVKQEKRWEFKNQLPIYRIEGRTLGLIAFGKIAQSLAQKAQGLGLKIIAYDPFVDNEVMQSKNVEKVAIDELLERSDYISIHAPLNSNTEKMLGKSEFKKMKNSAYVINTARGAIIDENSLVKALESGDIAGAGLDVLNSENFDPENPLLDFNNVIITPHAGFYSEEALRDLQRIASMEIVRVLKGEEPMYCVNCKDLKKYKR
jgi:D-3-phosphoglycerate dehydrogenase / 2-oxoglutarate reductase